VTWVVDFIASSPARIACVSAWAACLVLLFVLVPPHHEGDRPSAASRAAAALRSRLRLSGPARLHKWNLLVRKVFHLAAFAMFALPVAAGPDTHALLYLAFAVAAKALLLLECARALRLPPAWLVGGVHAYMTRYTDTRDAGAFVLTHIYLLLGCALPMWLSGMPGCLDYDRSPAAAAGTSGAPGCCANPPLMSVIFPLAGTLALGVGDAMAAVVGIIASARGRAHTWGHLLAAPPGGVRARWPGANKTVEGTSAFIVCTLLATAAVYAAARGAAGGWSAMFRGAAPGDSPEPWAGVVAAVAVSALLETFTEGIDNAALPLCTWCLLRWFV
jgi:dolichol kinase